MTGGPGRAAVTVTVGRCVDAGSKGDVEGQLNSPARAHPRSFESPKMVSYVGLFRYADRRDKVCIILGVLAAAIGGTLMPVFTIFLGEMVNALGDPTKNLMDDLRRNILNIVYLSIGALTVGYLEVVCCTISGQQQAYRVRGAYLQSILKQDMSWHDTDGSIGKIIHGLNDETEAFKTSISTRLGMFIRNVATAVAALVVSFVRGWQLTLIIIATMPALMIVSMGVSVFTRRLQAQVLVSNVSANSLVQQAISSIRTVAAYGMEPSLVSKYDNELAAPESAGIRQGYLSGLVIGSTNGVFFCSISLGTWYGSQCVADGTYNGGQVLSILLAGMLGGWSLGQAIPHLKHFQQGQAAAAHLFAVIVRKPDIDVDGRGEILPEVRGDVELENVKFYYPTRPDRLIFYDFSLTIPAGTTVALVGESGSGKSTIIQLIERFYDPIDGQVMLDGHNIKSLQVAWLRSQVALVNQEPTLFNTTIYENIANSRPDATQEEVIAAAAAANAHGFIIKLPNGYNTQVGDKGGQLSGGQRQRIAIARAILRDPKVLLLDEATSALDAQSERAVQDALSTLMSDRTTVVVAHRLSTIMAADDIAVVCGGKVVEQGSHNDLMQISGGVYAGMISRQQLMPHDENMPDSQECGLRQKYACSPTKEKPVLRQSVLRRASVRLSVIPQDIVKKLTKHIGNSSDNGGHRFKRCLPFVRTDWRYIFGGMLTSIALGAQMPGKLACLQICISSIQHFSCNQLTQIYCLESAGFALALSGITHVYYDPNPDDVKSGGSKWGIIFVGIGAAAVLLSTLQGWCFGVVSHRLAHRLRVKYFQAVLRQEMAWFDNANNSVGETMSRISNDISSLQGAIGDATGACLQNLSMVIIGLSISFTASWSLTLVTLAALPFMVFAQMMQSAQSFGGAHKMDNEIAQANQVALEAISAIRVVSAYSLQARTSQIYEQLAQMGTSKSAHVSGLSFGLSQLILFLYYCLAFWFGGTQVDDGNITFENMVKAFNVIFFVAMGMGTASAQLPELGKVGPATQRVFALIDSTPGIDVHKAGAEPLIDGDVELKSVTFAYPTRPGRLIFKQFNLKVQAGSSCALVGESGHGKSTIIGLLERFYDPVDGQILIDGLDLQTVSIKYLRSQIGLVGQEPIMFSATILENIKIGNPNATMSQVVEAARISNALSYIEKLPEAYDTRLGEGGVQLSGGQKQRIAIARAVLRNPRILMLDEATAALDAESERLVQDALHLAMAGRTTFVVAHRLSTIVDCDKIAAIYRGRVLEEGNHSHLMALNGYYAYLVAASST